METDILHHHSQQVLAPDFSILTPVDKEMFKAFKTPATLVPLSGRKDA